MKTLISFFAIATFFVSYTYGQKQNFEDRQFLETIFQELNNDELNMEESEALVAEAEESQDHVVVLSEAEAEVDQTMDMAENDEDDDVKAVSLLAMSEEQEIEEIEHYDEALDPENQD